MKPFRERNPVVIGFASLAVVAAMMLAAFRAESLPLIGGGDVYYAAFAESGGLEVGDEVRLAGVRVGQVEEIALDGDQVLVTFRVDKGTDFGQDTAASIRIKTLLGALFIQLEPDGVGQLEPDSTIPVARTDAPYDVVSAFSDLSSTTERIDTERLAKAFDTLAGVAEKTPQEVRGSLVGLSRLSRVVASKDAQLNRLLRNLEQVSGVIADRNTELVTLFEDGDVLFRAVAARRAAIHDLLVASRQLSTELSGLIDDTRADLAPALANLSDVVDTLERNQSELDSTIRLMAPFYRVFANTLGTGPWFDTYIQNMPPVPAVPGLPELPELPVRGGRS